MAYIKQRGNHQWRAQIRRKGHPAQNKTFNTRKEAEAWARLIETEMDRGIFVDRTESERTTLAEALERYRREVTVRKKSAPRENVRINYWLSLPVAARTMASLRGSDFARFRDDRRKEGKAESTIRLDLALVSHVFEVARKEWGMEALPNPVKSIALPGQSRKRDRRLREGEENRILAELRKSRNKYAAPMMQFAIETAMRQSEILSLTWDSVDTNKRVAYLNETKNGESRDVPLSSRAIALLDALPRHIRDGRIFLISQDGISRGFARAVQKARRIYEEECRTKSSISAPNFLCDLRFHDLRHEATSRLFEQGLIQQEVATITGHKTQAMLTRYTHLKAEDLANKLR